MPAAEIPALCTTANGVPMVSPMVLAATSTDAWSIRSSWTPINRSSSGAAPVASRSCAMPCSGVRMAATTRHPSRYRRAAVANPSPREAPVMTTLRASAILARARALARWWRLDVRPAVRLSASPGRPDAHRVGTLRAGLLVKALRVIHFGFRIRPRAGHRSSGVADFDDPEPCAVSEVGHVDDREHHQECAKHRSGWEQLRLGGKLFRDRLTGVVAIAQDRRGHHHEAHRERLPDQWELEGGAGEHRSPRDHLRVDVHAGVHELNFEP